MSGGPARARKATCRPATPSNVVAFPTTTVADLRRRLRNCHNLRMHDRWTDAFKALADRLTAEDARELAILACRARYELALAEGC